MLRGKSMWPTSRSRAPRPQLRRTARMCMSCPSRRSPCPWPSSRVAQVSRPVSLPALCLGVGRLWKPENSVLAVDTVGDEDTSGVRSRPPWLHLRLGCVRRRRNPLLDVEASCQQA